MAAVPEPHLTAVPSWGRRKWREWRLFIVLLAALLLVRSIVIDWNQVPTGSMLPTIQIGDQIVVDKRAYALRLPFSDLRVVTYNQPQRGDIVTFPSPLDGDLYVKRVIGIGGDRVRMVNNQLWVNDTAANYRELARDPITGERIVEEALFDLRYQIQLAALPPFKASFPEIEVPMGQLLVLGDNRDQSFDSRAIGFVPASSVLGQATSVAFSLQYDDFLLPRSNRSFVSLTADVANAAQ